MNENIKRLFNKQPEPDFTSSTKMHYGGIYALQRNNKTGKIHFRKLTKRQQKILKMADEIIVKIMEE